MALSEKEVQHAIEERRDRLDDLELDYEDESYEESEFAEALQEVEKGEGVTLKDIGTAYYVDYIHINEDLSLIFKIGEQLFRIRGYYNSYDNDEWETDVEEVIPEEQVVIVYTRVTRG